MLNSRQTILIIAFNAYKKFPWFPTFLFQLCNSEIIHFHPGNHMQSSHEGFTMPQALMDFDILMRIYLEVL